MSPAESYSKYERTFARVVLAIFAAIALLFGVLVFLAFMSCARRIGEHAEPAARSYERERVDLSALNSQLPVAPKSVEGGSALNFPNPSTNAATAGECSTSIASAHRSEAPASRGPLGCRLLNAVCSQPAGRFPSRSGHPVFLFPGASDTATHSTPTLPASCVTLEINPMVCKTAQHAGTVESATVPATASARSYERERVDSEFRYTRYPLLATRYSETCLSFRFKALPPVLVPTHCHATHARANARLPDTFQHQVNPAFLVPANAAHWQAATLSTRQIAKKQALADVGLAKAA